MQLPISDEMEMLHTPEHCNFAVIKFPFDAVRLVFSHPVILYVTYRVLRYQWQSSGIVSYLDPQDRYSFAVSNFAAWDEYAERVTDELDITPIAGAIDSSVSTHQVSPV